MAYPYRAHADLPAGVPLPGMVRLGPLAIGIYQASKEDATASAAGSGAYPTSRYGVVPWANLSRAGRRWPWHATSARGCRHGRMAGAVQFNPGSATPAVMNGNTNSGASSDDATQSGTSDPTQAGRTLTGTGPAYDQCRRDSRGALLVFAGWPGRPSRQTYGNGLQFFGGSRPPIRGTSSLGQ